MVKDRALDRKLRLRVLERDGWRCLRCRVVLRPHGGTPGPDTATVDHVLAVSRGGWDDPVNLQALCLACNVWKGDRFVDFRPLALRAALRVARASRTEVGWKPAGRPAAVRGSSRTITVGFKVSAAEQEALRAWFPNAGAMRATLLAVSDEIVAAA